MKRPVNLWFIRFLIARSGIIISGILLGVAARYLFGPPATDQINLSKPDIEATKLFGEKLDHYHGMMEKAEELSQERHRQEMEAVGDILINSRN